MMFFSEILLAVFLLLCIELTASSRLLHCIRLTALQGVVIALYPVAVRDWSAGTPGLEFYLLAFASLGVKALLLPKLLDRAMRKAHVNRELEPLVGYTASLLIVLAAGALAFAGCRNMTLPEGSLRLGAPVAFTAMFTGLFLLCSRRKAITQVIGFLTFENGIGLFGMSTHIESGFLVELGILLDVFVLVFVMGIAVFQISREFSHIDSDRLHELSDLTQNSAAPAEGEVK